MPIAPAPATPPDAHTPLSKLPNFDPRAVPVIGVDSHLAAVRAEALAPEALRARFANPPAWEPELRGEPRFSERAPAHASVLVPIVQRERPMMLLTERTTHLSTHSGQVAFPGGKRDDTDVDAADTALREAHEEIGLTRDLAEVIGEMPIYRTGTNFIITPVVALVSPDYQLALNEFEVADAFEFAGARREWFSMPYMDGRTERFVWGATAAMLRNLYRFLAA